MKRREVIKLIGGVAASWPLAIRAQQRDEVRRIGVIVNVAVDDPEAQASVAAFKQALQQLGWSDERNLQIDLRGTAGDPERMQAFAKELIALKPDVILSRSTPVSGPEADAYNPDCFHGGLRPRRGALRRKSGASGR